MIPLGYRATYSEKRWLVGELKFRRSMRKAGYRNVSDGDVFHRPQTGAKIVDVKIDETGESIWVKEQSQ